MRQGLETSVVRAMAAILRSLHPAAARRVAHGIGTLAWRLGARRRVTDENLQRAFPDWSQAQRDAVCRRSYVGLVSTAVEVLRLTPERLQQPDMQVRFDGWEHLEAASRAGGGAIVASAHMGNWEVCAAAGRAAGLNVTMVVQSLRNKQLDTMLNDIRRRMGLEVLERGMALRRIREHLQRNQLVAVMCDQDARTRGVFVPFFGHPASTHKGAAQLAYREGVPLLPFLAHRQVDGTHVMRVHPPLTAPAGASEEEFVRCTMEGFHRILEQEVREHPSDYLWQHRRWKTAPPAAPATGQPTGLAAEDPGTASGKEAARSR